jgi:hypothetical protein
VQCDNSAADFNPANWHGPIMPHGPLDPSHSTRLAVECPVCGHYTEKPLPWLKTADLMECGSCGMTVDLMSGERREEIEKLYASSLRSGG